MRSPSRLVHELLADSTLPHRQYTSFTKQRDELIARQDELDESSTSITELIEVLDARKDEAIERTFKQVAKNFEEVFEKLVPAGRGRLIMQRRQMEKVSLALPRAILGRAKLRMKTNLLASHTGRR